MVIGVKMPGTGAGNVKLSQIGMKLTLAHKNARRYTTGNRDAPGESSKHPPCGGAANPEGLGE